jgi:hypothetical protein
MGTTTSHYSLYKPDDGESGYTTTFNANFDTIDTTLNDHETRLDVVEAPVGGTTGARPATPTLYQGYFDATLGKPIWWDGTTWVDATGATV